MDKYETLNALLATAIAQAQVDRFDPKAAAEAAARAFRAGLAAFDEVASRSTRSRQSTSKSVSTDTQRRK